MRYTDQPPERDEHQTGNERVSPSFLPVLHFERRKRHEQSRDDAGEHTADIGRHPCHEKGAPGTAQGGGQSQHPRIDMRRSKASQQQKISRIMLVLERVDNEISEGKPRPVQAKNLVIPKRLVGKAVKPQQQGKQSQDERQRHRRPRKT